MALSQQVWDDIRRDLDAAEASWRCKEVSNAGDFSYEVPGVGAQTRSYSQAEKDACASDLTTKLGTFKTNAAAITE